MLIRIAFNPSGAIEKNSDVFLVYQGWKLSWNNEWKFDLER
jgi:hypothetical protein